MLFNTDSVIKTRSFISLPFRFFKQILWGNKCLLCVNVLHIIFYSDFVYVLICVIFKLFILIDLF